MFVDILDEISDMLETGGYTITDPRYKRGYIYGISKMEDHVSDFYTLNGLRSTVGND